MFKMFFGLKIIFTTFTRTSQISHLLFSSPFQIHFKQNLISVIKLSNDPEYPGCVSAITVYLVARRTELKLALLPNVHYMLFKSSKVTKATCWLEKSAEFFQMLQFKNILTTQNLFLYMMIPFSSYRLWKVTEYTTQRTACTIFN